MRCPDCGKYRDIRGTTADRLACAGPYHTAPEALDALARAVEIYKTAEERPFEVSMVKVMSKVTLGGRGGELRG